MSNRFIDYWEDYEDAYTIPINDYLTEDDAIFKTKYFFLDKQIKFSGKMKFLSLDNGNFNNRADFSLQQQPWEDSNYYLSVKSNGETTLDSYWLFAKQPNIKYQLYKKITATINEKEKKGDYKCHLRAIHQNFIISAGLDNFNPFECANEKNPESSHRMCIPNLSMWTLYGLRKDNQHIFGGVSLSYNWMNYKFDNFKILASLNCKDSMFKTHFETIINNNPVEGKSDYYPLFKIYFDTRPLDNLRVLTSFEYDSKKADVMKWNCTNEITIDKLTKCKIRINNNNTLTSTILRKIGFFNFAFTSNVNCVPSQNTKNSYFKFKFGALLELVDL